MKTCPVCKYEVQEQEEECPQYGLIFSKRDGHAPKPPTDPILQRDKTRKQKYWGLGLVVLGLVLEVIGLKVGYLAIFVLVLGMVVCGIGLAYYGTAKGSNVAWCAMALGLFIMPILGIFILLLLKDRTGLEIKDHPRPEIEDRTELKAKARGMSEAQLKWGIFIYTGFLACGILFLFNLLPYIWSRLVLAEEQWHPSLDLVADVTGFMFLFFIVFVVSISFFVECYHASRSPGLCASAVWLIIRAGLVGLTAIAVFGASGTMLKAGRIFEDRSVKWLSQLQHGMPRNDVEILILKTNALLIRDPNRRNGISANDNTEYQRVLYALENASQGQPVNFRVLDFHKVLFKLNLVSPPKEGYSKAISFCTDVLWLYV